LRDKQRRRAQVDDLNTRAVKRWYELNFCHILINQKDDEKELLVNQQAELGEKNVHDILSYQHMESTAI